MSLRREYKVWCRFTISLDDERLKDVEELLKARFNEMLGTMERKDDIRIVLVHSFEVEEQR